MRIEHDNVPILGAPAELDVKGVATRGELFALVDGKDLLCLPFGNPPGTPDASGVWYKVELLERTEGWIFAEPSGDSGAPFATRLSLQNGALVAVRGQYSRELDAAAEAMEDAQANGAKAGDQDGRRAGYAAGLADASKAAEGRSYDDAIENLYASGSYSRLPAYTLLAILSGFVLGFCVQYGAVSILRRCGFLHDIDPIILGEHTDVADLRNSATSLASHARSNSPSAHRGFLPILILPLFLSFLGCEPPPEKEAYRKAYDAHYQAGVQAGQEAGRADGKKIGEEKGRVAAGEDAATGRAWRLYISPALSALICGVVAGLLVQYAALLACRLSDRLQCALTAYFSNDYRSLLLKPAATDTYRRLTVALVPAMRTSTSYFILQQLGRLLASTERILAVGRLHASQIVAKLEASTKLKDVEKARLGVLISLAVKELDEIFRNEQARVDKYVGRTDPMR